MKKVVDIRILAMVAFLCTCLAGCISDDGVDCPGGKDVDYSNRESYFTVTVCMPSETTRADATDGEDADSTEFGTDPEDLIEDISYFLFRVSSWDAGEGSSCMYSGTLDKDNAEEWQMLTNGVRLTFKIKGYVPMQNDHIIVAANLGKDVARRLTTLGTLRSYTGYTCWRAGKTLAECDHFVMSSAYNDPGNGTVQTQGKAGTKVDPYITDIVLHRNAARIDFKFNPVGNVSGNAPYSRMDYKVHSTPGDETTPQVGTLHLTNIIPFNLTQGSSYLIRRVTSGSDIAHDVVYGGRVKLDTHGVPLNYVIEPHTLDKHSGVTESDQERLAQWYGSTRASEVFAHPDGHLEGTDISTYSQNVRTVDGDTFMTVSYANENTQPKDKQLKQYMTGLLLKGVYEPLKVYSDQDAKVLSTESFTDGRTFWRYVPMQGGVIEGDCLYFDNADAARNYQRTHGGGSGVVTEYPGGVCYYNIWIRHARVDGLTQPYPMEYAIVRNNIYRVEIDHVTGPGSPLPDYDNVDKLNIHIYVRKWNLRKQPTIRL